MPAVSIIIPVYQVVAHLARCLDSVLAQDFQDTEIICVDDGSTDGSAAILESYAQREPRLRVITQENQGLSMARNNGLAEARGEYILFVDSDDAIHPNTIATCYAFAQKYQADIVSFMLKQISSDTQMPLNELPGYHTAISPIKTIPHKLTQTPLQHCVKRGHFLILCNSYTKLYRRRFVSQFSFIPGITYEDYPHTVSLMAHHPRTVLTELPLYYYFYNPASISNQRLEPRHVRDYHTGLCSLLEAFSKSPKAERDFIHRKVVPNYLKQQYNRIRRSSLESQEPLWDAFTLELTDLDNRGAISIIGNKLSCYWTH